ncbi:hypothetical protein AB1Y20_014050 [Prymnesium parvum]|uniref:CUB domain-containing protein n=1 Tax=Prymnesium parvum TaxID=97485 RepID=A0AB34IHG3_PRYPA
MCDVLTAPYGHLQSENGDYENGNVRCWVIRPPGKRRIHLSFLSFETELSFDVVHVYDGGDPSAPLLSPLEGFSGMETPAPLSSTGGELLLTFQADYFFHLAGFTFAWTSDDGADLPPPLCAPSCNATHDVGDGVCHAACFNAQCGWDGNDCSLPCNATSKCDFYQVADGTCDPHCLVAGCGFDNQDCACNNTLTSPYGFASDGSDAQHDYNDSLRLCWQLKLEDPTKRIALSFARFDVEPYFDLVTIFDGPTEAHPPLFQGRGYSGIKLKGALDELQKNSSGSSMLIHFYSDATITESGFLFGWTTLPLPPPEKGCALDCTPDMPGNKICDPACMNSFCAWDKDDCRELECAAGCTTDMINNEVCDSACMNAECNYDGRDCECHNVRAAEAGFDDDGSSATDDYENGLQRCWLIRPKREGAKKITLSFQRFDVEETYDRVMVYDGNNSMSSKQLYPYSLSGDRLPHPVSSTGGQILITFESDLSITESGFAFGWTTEFESDGPLPHWQCSPQCNTSQIGDEVCHHACMNEACEWDGGDCSGSCEGTPLEGGGRAICQHDELGDGVCHHRCFTANCNYDYRDCECSNVLSEGGAYVNVSYADKEQLCWLIRPKLPMPVARITLSFRYFDTEAEDKLVVYDGQNMVDSLVLTPPGGLSGHRSGAALPRLTAHGGKLLLVFSSDKSARGAGFLFGWTSAVEGHEGEGCAWNCTEPMRGDGRCDAACMNAECNWDAPLGSSRSDCDGACTHGCTPPPPPPPPPSGGWVGWVVWLSLLACGCALCARAGGRGGDGAPVIGQMGTARMQPMEEGERRWSWNDLQYTAFSFYSQLRQIRDEVLAGQLRLADVPLRVRRATARPIRDEAEESQEML